MKNKKIDENNEQENNYEIMRRNEPSIFNKKSKIVIEKPLRYIESDTGKTRHFTPAAQE